MPDQPGKTTKKKARPVNLDTLGLEMGNNRLKLLKSKRLSLALCSSNPHPWTPRLRN